MHLCKLSRSSPRPSPYRMGRAVMAREKQPRQIMQMTVAQFEATFPDEEA